MPKQKKLNLDALFAFVLRTKQYIVGRDTLKRNKRKLHFVLITEDLSENGLKFISKNFDEIPIIQKYTMDELEEKLQLNGTKIVGFKKSDLSKAVYEQLKNWRLNG